MGKIEGVSIKNFGAAKRYSNGENTLEARGSSS